MPQRFALYYAPTTTDLLWSRAALWLGRDPAGHEIRAASISGIDPEYRLAISRSARRYGFHATLKAPMTLPDGLGPGELEAALLDFGRKCRPVAIGRLVPRFIDGFLALVPEAQSQELTDFAAAVVAGFDRFRAPLTPGDRIRRLAGGTLSPRQIELLDDYGYPYVMDEFRFHMTLTDRLPENERDAVMAAAADWFAPAIEKPLVLDRIALFEEPHAGDAFVRRGDFELRAEAMADV
jgi:hypothetical protein